MSKTVDAARQKSTQTLKKSWHVIKIKWTAIKNSSPVKPHKLVEKQVPRTYT